MGNSAPTSAGEGELTGRAALVTGAARRVGASIAHALAARGMRIAVHYHASRQQAEATCASLREAGGDAFPIAADLADRTQARNLVDEATERLGRLDLLVPSAANFERIPYDHVDEAAWDRALRLNLDGPFVLAKRATPALRASRGSIVFITCTTAAAPYRHHLPYVVSKGAVRQLMRTLSLELAPDVRVNAVAPGTVLPPETMSSDAVAQLRKEIPLQRTGRPEDVADAVAYLAAAPFVTGQELVVDGGWAVGGVGSGG